MTDSPNIYATVQGRQYFAELSDSYSFHDRFAKQALPLLISLLSIKNNLLVGTLLVQCFSQGCEGQCQSILTDGDGRSQRECCIDIQYGKMPP
jgi:hypothetical protein